MSRLFHEVNKSQNKQQENILASINDTYLVTTLYKNIMSSLRTKTYVCSDALSVIKVSANAMSTLKQTQLGGTQLGGGGCTLPCPSSVFV